MRFSYALVALIGAAHAMVCAHTPLPYPLTRLNIILLTRTPQKPTVGSLVTGRSVCNSGDCKGVARAVVADQAALEARKKSKAAKADAANATAEARRSVGSNKDSSKRSKNLVQEEARALGDAVDSLVGDVTGTVGDVTETVGLKTRDGKEVRAAVTDDAAIGARKQSKAAKSAASNATAEARSVVDRKGRSVNLDERAAVTDDAALDARKQSKASKSAASNATAEARSITDDAAIDARQQSKEAKSAAANGTAKARSVGAGAPKSRKSRRSHQLW